MGFLNQKAAQKQPDFGLACSGGKDIYVCWPVFNILCVLVVVAANFSETDAEGSFNTCL